LWIFLRAASGPAVYRLMGKFYELLVVGTILIISE
jgi:hypothetical protein